MEEPDFKSLLHESLLGIDDAFTKNNVPIKDRALQATLIFFEQCITSIHSNEIQNYEDDKHYTDTPLFPAVSNYVDNWYKKRYGEALNESGLGLYGLVFFRNCPFAISFPYYMSIDEGDPETISVKFLDKYTDLENWEDYLLSPPNLKEMSDSEYIELKRLVIESIGINRNIFHNICVGNTSNPDERAFSHDVLLHLKNATQMISCSNYNNYNLSVWELHMAIEKTIKLLLVQKSINYPTIHDLKKLLLLALEDEYCHILTNLDLFPKSKDVISIRYGDPSITDISYVKTLYYLAINIVSELSGFMRKEKIDVRNGTVYMKRPKYAGTTLA